MIRKIINMLGPNNRKYIPDLFEWEVFSPVGLWPFNQRARNIRKMVQADFMSRYEKTGQGYYSRYDWMRLEYCLPLLVGKSVLDIGPYNGAFLFMMKELGQFDRIDCLDIVEHPCLQLPEGSKLHLKDVTKMDFSENSFDTICAMEIIEHLPPEMVQPAIDKIRKVAAKRVIYSLPFKEAFPLFKENEESGHKQSFDEVKIHGLFPSAKFAPVQAGLGVPWVIIVEEQDELGQIRPFELLSPEKLLKEKATKTLH